MTSGVNPPPRNPHVQIGSHEIGPGRPVFFVGEIGVNHNGSLETTKKLIDVAVDAGCNSVKFQKRTIDIVYTPQELAAPRKSVFGDTNGMLKYGLEFSFEDYVGLSIYCRRKKILWWASPWDVDSVDFLEQVYPAAYKIASPMLTNCEFLERVKETKKPSSRNSYRRWE